MPFEINTKYTGFRLDHPDFGDVGKTNYAKGIVKGFGLKSTDPLLLDDTLTVEVGGVQTSVPIFYHCRKNTKVPVLLENLALFGSAFAFLPNDEVIVAINDGTPVAVLGLANISQEKPVAMIRRCQSLFKVVIWEQNPESGGYPDGEGGYFPPGYVTTLYYLDALDQTVYHQHQEAGGVIHSAIPILDPWDVDMEDADLSYYCGESPALICNASGPAVAPYGAEDDKLMLVGPLVYIFQRFAYNSFKILAGVLDPETIQNIYDIGNNASGSGDGYNPTYPGMYEQSGLKNLLWNNMTQEVEAGIDDPYFATWAQRHFPYQYPNGKYPLPEGYF